jgi:hypothetical protein
MLEVEHARERSPSYSPNLAKKRKMVIEMTFPFM